MRAALVALLLAFGSVAPAMACPVDMSMSGDSAPASKAVPDRAQICAMCCVILADAPAVVALQAPAAIQRSVTFDFVVGLETKPELRPPQTYLA